MPTGKRIDGLDGLRGIAALAIFLFHARPVAGANAFLAVDFFFMLSGYVMARTYEARLGAEGAGGRFVLARIRRLWPTVALGSLFSLPFVVHFMPGGIAAMLALANLLLIPTFAYNQVYIINPPLWSIALELMANGAHAGVIWRLRGRVGLVLLGLVVVLFVAAAAWRQDVDMGSRPGNFVFGPIRVLASYGIGVMLWRAWRDVPPFRVPALVTWLAMPVWFVLGTKAVGSVWWFDLVFVLALCPVLIAGGLQHGGGSWLAQRAGALSFPLYAVHAPVLFSVRTYEGPLWLQIAASLVAAWGLHWAIQRLSGKKTFPT